MASPSATSSLPPPLRPIAIDFWAATDVGRERDHNEDNFLIDKGLHLFVVADGMGGHAAGEIASATAVSEVRETLGENRDLLERFDRGEDVQPMEILQILEHAVQRACGAIFARAQREPEKRGMGTTCSVLLIAGTADRPRAFIAHVGDSRIYLIRHSQAHQLTEDHSLRNELLRRGKIQSDADLENSPYRRFKNAVTRAVGVYESVAVDTFDLDILPGDQFLLCSDGLHGYFAEDYFTRVFAEAPLKELPKRLVDDANEKGGQDNITAICLQIAGDLRSDVSEQLSLTLEVLRKMSLFRFLSYTELVRVMNLCQSRPVSQGESLFERGDSGEELFLIVTGEVELHSGDTTIATLSQGNHFGEMALVDRRPRSLSATAGSAGQLLVLSRTDFYEVIKSEPELATKLLWSFVQVLADRLRKTTADLSGQRGEHTSPDALEALSGGPLWSADPLVEPGSDD